MHFSSTLLLVLMSVDMFESLQTVVALPNKGSRLCLRPTSVFRPSSMLRPPIVHMCTTEGGDDDPDTDFQVCLRDPDTDRSLECELLETVEYAGRLYASMTPIDTPVAIAVIDNGIMLEIEDEDLLMDLLPTAQAVASEMDLNLQNTAVTMTISGDLDELVEFDESKLGLDEESDSAMDDDDDDADDAAEVLLSFGHEGETYYIVRLLEPVFIVGAHAIMLLMVLHNSPHSPRHA